MSPSDLLARISGSKLGAWIGLAIAAFVGACTIMPEKFSEVSPAYGARFCAGMAILGILAASVSKGVGDRRTGTQVTAVHTFAAVKPNERRRGGSKP